MAPNVSIQPYHVPALLAETLARLAPGPAGVWVDATLGGGGHSRAILQRLGPEGRLVGLDHDPEAHAETEPLRADGRFCLVAGNFRDLGTVLRRLRIEAVDGILADLGVSSHQLDEARRGFSYRTDGPLDMRMNPDQALTAAAVVNTYDEGQIANLLYRYGEVRGARKMAKCLVAARARKPIATTFELVEALRPELPRHNDYSLLSQVFQALRIEVNDEMGALMAFLEASLQALKPEGRLAVISYHSLEDRLVKNFLRTGNFGGELKKDFFGNPESPWVPVTRKAIGPTPAEVAANPRARSAKLRVAAKAPTQPEQAITN